MAVARFPPEADQPLAGASYKFTEFMFTVYILRSLKNFKRYVGYTSKSAEQRLKEHNTGSNKFTSQNKPFELICSEVYPTKADAMKRERFLKSGVGRKWIDVNVRG